MTVTLVKELKLEDAAIYLFQEERREYWLAKDFKIENKKISRFLTSEPYISFLGSRKAIVVWEEEKHHAVEAYIAVSIPLVFKEKLIGIIHLGYKKTEQMYSHEDLELLRRLSEKITVALINAKEYDAIGKLYEVHNRQEKIKGLAELTAGLSHNFRNRLCTIKQLFGFFASDSKHEDLVEMYKLAEPDVKLMEEILDEIDRFDEAGVKRIAHYNVDINSLLNKIISKLYSDGKLEKIEVITELEKNLPCILGEEQALENIFLPIMINGIEAISAETRLYNENTIEKDLLEKGLPPEVLAKMGLLAEASANGVMGDKKENKLIIKTSAVNKQFKMENKQQEYVQVEITDTGEGIKESDLPKIFNPLHTTKSQRIGLNLAIAHRIIEAMGGFIDIKSKWGEGTSFFVNLPVDCKPREEEIIQMKDTHREGTKAYMGMKDTV